MVDEEKRDEKILAVRDPKAVKRHLSEKQEKFTKAFLANGGNATAAVKESYGDIKQARSM